MEDERIEAVKTWLEPKSVQDTSKRPPRERELLGNQMKKAALIKKIFIAFLNELLSNYYKRGNKYT